MVPRRHPVVTPGGDVFRRAVERDPFRRNLVTNCVTYFNSTQVDSNAYSFDALSRPTARTTSRTGCQPVQSSFSYNERSEVLSAAIGTNLFAHAYDGIGNHLLFGDNTVTNVFTHNSLNQIESHSIGNEPPYELEYSIDGGLSTDWVWDYSYDAADRLSSVVPTFPEDGSMRVLNEYDYRNRRIRKIVQRLTVTLPPPPSPPIENHTWDTIETRTFVYDDWNLIHETIYTIDGGTTNTTEVQYFWGLDLSDSLHGAGGVGGLLALSSNGLFYFPAYDNNGNVTRYIDESGNVVATYEYDDFGKLISQSGPLADLFHIRFSTKYCDPETGLYYYGERFYSPDWRIWLNRDPIEESGGLNIYSFCGNHPIEGIDLLGLKIRSAVTPSKCSDKDIDAEAKKVLANAVVFTQEGSPRLEHYGNLCCACRKGKYEVIVTGPIPGKIVVSYSQYKGRSYKQEIPASFPDDPRIRCPQGSQRVGYYHTHVSGRSFSDSDLDVLKTRDHPYYMSQDGRRIEKAVPLRTDNPIQAGFPSTAIAPGGFPMDPIVIILE